MNTIIDRLNRVALKFNPRTLVGIVASLFAVSARANTFDYSQVDAAGSTTGLGGFIDAYGNTALLIMVGLGVIGTAWIGVELMFFDKELRDVKKGLIGVVILIAGPAIIYLGMAHSATMAAGTQ